MSNISSQCRSEVSADQDHGEVEQYVTFRVGGQLFAFPMNTVREIIRFPSLVDVPLTPRALVGIANLRGNTLPVVDLRTLLDIGELEYSDSTRVVVADDGQSVGLVVDGVSRVIEIDASEIETSADLGDDSDCSFIAGVIRQEQNGEMIQLLDVEALVRSEFPADPDTSAAMSGNSVLRADDAAADEDEESNSTIQLVTFMIADQEYAFRLSDVQEVIRVPDEISAVPHAGEHVQGLIDLRGRFLPLVGTASLLGIDSSCDQAAMRVLVIGVRRPGGATESMGLLVDGVREVLTVDEGELGPVPAFLCEDDEGPDVSAICKLDNGERIISVLDAESVVHSPLIKAALDECNEGEDMLDRNPDEEQVSEADDDNAQLVVFTLDDQEFAIGIESVQEITRIPERLDVVPKAPPFVEGVVNLRGAVLPILDMRSRFGLPKAEPSDRQRIVVVDVSGTRTGFVVDSVSEVLRLPLKSIENAPPLSDEQMRMVGRMVNLDEGRRMIQVVAADQLLDDSEKTTIEEDISG